MLYKYIPYKGMLRCYTNVYHIRACQECCTTAVIHHIVYSGRKTKYVIKTICHKKQIPSVCAGITITSHKPYWYISSIKLICALSEIMWIVITRPHGCVIITDGKLLMLRSVKCWSRTVGGRLCSQSIKWPICQNKDSLRSLLVSRFHQFWQ